MLAIVSKLGRAAGSVVLLGGIAAAGPAAQESGTAPDPSGPPRGEQREECQGESCDKQADESVSPPERSVPPPEERRPPSKSRKERRPSRSY